MYNLPMIKEGLYRQDRFQSPLAECFFFFCVWVQSKDKTLKLIDGMCHSLIREPGNEDVQITTLEWLLKRL